MGLKESKHLFVIQSLTPLSLPHVPSPFPPLLLHHALLSNESSQDACTDGPAAACYPSGSCWHGRLLGPLPIIPSLNRSPKSVLASKLNAEVQGPSQSGCWATWWLPGAADTKETAHMSPRTRFNRIKLAHYCWFMVCLCLGRSEAENKWVHCVLTKKTKKKQHMHAHLHPHSSQTQDWITDQAFQLPTRSPDSRCDTSLTEVGNCSRGSTGTHFPNPFYWNPPLVSDRGSCWHSGTCFTPTSSVSINVKLTGNSPPLTHPAHVCIHPHSWASLDIVVCMHVFLFLCVLANRAS